MLIVMHQISATLFEWLFDRSTVYGEGGMYPDPLYIVLQLKNI